MRPKKAILIFSAVESGVASAIFVLNTRGYKARAVHTVAEFEAELADFAPDAALLYYDGGCMVAPVRACEALVHEAGIHSVIVARCAGEVDFSVSSMRLPKHTASMGAICECLRILCVRKRGPGKKKDSANSMRQTVSAATVTAAYARLG